MSLTDEQIRKIMQKEIEAKTVLLKEDEVETIVREHINFGWELVNKTPCGAKIKVTFRKVK